MTVRSTPFSYLDNPGPRADTSTTTRCACPTLALRTRMLRVAVGRRIENHAPVVSDVRHFRHLVRAVPLGRPLLHAPSLVTSIGVLGASGDPPAGQGECRNPPTVPVVPVTATLRATVGNVGRRSAGRPTGRSS